MSTGVLWFLCIALSIASMAIHLFQHTVMYLRWNIIFTIILKITAAYLGVNKYIHIDVNHFILFSSSHVMYESLRSKPIDGFGLVLQS